MEEVGVQAVMNTGRFDAGVKSYIAGLENMRMRTLAFAVTVGNLASRAIETLVQKLYSFLRGAADVAARAQSLSYVLQIVGQRAGYTVEQLDGYVEALRQTGIQTDEASSAIVQFIKNQLDLTQVTKLARVAQDAAVIGNVNSSEAFNRIIYGMTTYQTEILRGIGIQIRMDDAMKKYAETIDKTASSLTNAERTQAIMNAILEEGEKIAGSYEAAMQTPGKQLSSLSRDIYELTRVAGEPFLVAFANIVGIMREVAQAMRKLLEEGGALHGVMVALGGALAALTGILRDNVSAWLKVVTGAADFSSIVSSAFDTVAGGMSRAARNVGKTLDGTSQDFDEMARRMTEAGAAVARSVEETHKTTAEEFIDMAADAADWGANIVISLANGIIAGATAVINAMAYIYQIIASLLMPGSPPKLLPDIDKWGAAAITVYMEGWRNADFSVFKDISNIVSSFLRSLGDNDIAEKDVIPTILGSRAAIMDTINLVRATGKVTDDMLSNLMSKLGPVSDEFSAFIKNTLMQEAASKRLADAQKRLNDVTMFYDDVLRELNAQLADASDTYDENKRLVEIEEAMASGLLTQSEMADLSNERRKILLRQQIRDVEALKDTAVAAEEEKVEAAADEVNAIAMQIAAQKELINVQIEQNELIKQQIALMERLAESAKRGGGGGGGGGQELPIPAGGGGGGDLSITDAMSDAIKKAERRIRIRLMLMWKNIASSFRESTAPLTEAWNNIQEKFSVIFDPIKEIAINAFNAIGNALSYVWTQYIMPIVNGIIDLFQWQLPEATSVWQDVLANTFAPAIEKIWLAIQENLMPILAELKAWLDTNLPIAIEVASAYWKEVLWPAISELMTYIYETVVPLLADLVVWLIEQIPVALQTASDYWTDVLQPALEAVWDFMSIKVIPTVADIVNWLAVNVPAAISTSSDFWTGTLQPAMQSVWDFIDTYLLPIFSVVIDIVEITLGIALENCAVSWGIVVAAMIGVRNYIQEDLGPKIEWLTDNVI